MKLVIISDTHNQRDINLPEGDVLIHAGDLTALGRHGETQKMLNWLAGQKDKFKHILFTPGNHDFLFEREPYLAQQMCHDRGITYLEDRMVTIEGITFLGSPWTPIFYNWAFMKNEGELYRVYSRFPQADVLITHGPPYGILDQLSSGPDKGQHCGSRALLDYIRHNPPKIHVFGHIHDQPESTYRKEGTLFVNAAQVNDDNELRSHLKPIVINFDVKEQNVEPISQTQKDL